MIIQLGNNNLPIPIMPLRQDADLHARTIIDRYNAVVRN